MSNSPLNIGNSLGAEFAPKVNPLDYPSDKCSNCNNEVFIPGVIFKIIPGLELGQGPDNVQIPIKVFVCSKCGELSNADKEILNTHEKVKESINKKSNIII